MRVLVLFFESPLILMDQFKRDLSWGIHFLNFSCLKFLKSSHYFDEIDTLLGYAFHQTLKFYFGNNWSSLSEEWPIDNSLENWYLNWPSWVSVNLYSFLAPLIVVFAAHLCWNYLKNLIFFKRNHSMCFSQNLLTTWQIYFEC